MSDKKTNKSLKKEVNKKTNCNKQLKDKNNMIISNRKSLLINISLFVIDILLIIWSARNNYVNYATIDGESILIGNINNLLFGRNYIGLVITLFIFIYGLLLNKFLLKNKFNKKWLILIFVFILLINVLFVYLFTNKVY